MCALEDNKTVDLVTIPKGKTVMEVDGCMTRKLGQTMSASIKLDMLPKVKLKYKRGASTVLHLTVITGGYPAHYTPFDSSSSVHSYATPFTPIGVGVGSGLGLGLVLVISCQPL